MEITPGDVSERSTNVLVPACILAVVLSTATWLSVSVLLVLTKTPFLLDPVVVLSAPFASVMSSFSAWVVSFLVLVLSQWHQHQWAALQIWP